VRFKRVTVCYKSFKLPRLSSDCPRFLHLLPAVTHVCQAQKVPTVCHKYVRLLLALMGCHSSALDVWLTSSNRHKLDRQRLDSAFGRRHFCPLDRNIGTSKKGTNRCDPFLSSPTNFLCPHFLSPPLCRSVSSSPNRLSGSFAVTSFKSRCLLRAKASPLPLPSAAVCLSALSCPLAHSQTHTHRQITRTHHSPSKQSTEQVGRGRQREQERRGGGETVRRRAKAGLLCTAAAVAPLSHPPYTHIGLSSPAADSAHAPPSLL
jgi:hypothetical protein